MFEDQALRSAPVGTRQERGIPPMYQAVDRHCEKLAEMMKSPTWRSQGAGPHSFKPAVTLGPGAVVRGHKSPNPPTSEGMICSDQHSEDELENRNSSVQSVPPPPSGPTLVDEIQLDHDRQAIRLIGLHPFLKAPERTYILSATASCDVGPPQGALYGEMRRVRISEGRISAKSKAERPAGPLLETEGNVVRPNPGENDLVESHSFPFSTDIRTNSRVSSQEFNDNVMELMRRDEAIQSINNSLRSSHRQARAASPDEKQRFGGILERLRQQRPAQHSSGYSPLGDPAIIAFAPKTESSKNPAKRREHVRSDSGYASTSTSSRTSKGALRKPESPSTEVTVPEPLKDQHSQGGSHDSAFETSLKNSTLNPTAKEFSSTGGKVCSPVKPGRLTCHPVHSQLLLPPQKHSELAGSNLPLAIDPVVNGIQSAWYSPQANTSTPLMTLGSLPHGPSPHFPCVLPRIGRFTGATISPPPGLGIAGSAPPTGTFTGFSPGSCQPCMHGSIPGLVAPCYNGPFHQQLPSLMTCNNPTHQGMSSFGSPALTPATSTVMMSQGPPVSVPVQAAAQPSPGTVQVPKHVPKPKIPNTAGQQNWELMHELRRMHEPGYALKCKEKQKKRYMKQLEKTGGSGAQEKDQSSASTEEHMKQTEDQSTNGVTTTEQEALSSHAKAVKVV